MPDIYSKEKRSEIMSRVKGGNTAPELAVRKLLHAMGYRYRLHDKKLPGKPDIVLPRHKKIILVNGCFWHGHSDCRRAGRPSTNVDFWERKITRNQERDQETLKALGALGWNVMVVWSCETRDKERLTECIRRFMESPTVRVGR